MPMKIKVGDQWIDPTMPDIKPEEDVLKCQKCGCGWLELISVQQYSKRSFVILGQKPAPKTDIGFWLFRCPKCGNVHEPNVQVGPRDLARKGYDNFLDCMEKDIETKVTGEKV